MNRGITLVEVLVVVTIMGILTAGGYTFVTQFGARQNLKSATDTVVASLKSARNLAVSQQEPQGFTGSVTIVNVGFAGGEVYAYANSDTNHRYFSNRYNDNGGIEVVSGAIRFTAFDGKLGDANAVPLPYDSQVTVTVRSLDTGSTSIVVIHANGVIEE